MGQSRDAAQRTTTELTSPSSQMSLFCGCVRWRGVAVTVAVAMLALAAASPRQHSVKSSKLKFQDIDDYGSMSRSHRGRCKHSEPCAGPSTRPKYQGKYTNTQEIFFVHAKEVMSAPSLATLRSRTRMFSTTDQRRPQSLGFQITGKTDFMRIFLEAPFWFRRHGAAISINTNQYFVNYL